MRLQLADGREIELDELHQHRTYEGLLEGLPTKRRNKHYLEHLTEGRSGASYLIAPYERPIPGDAQEPYPFGEPAVLPSITCIARFRSMRPARDQTKDYSALTIIWLQEAFALPISDKVVESIRALDWGRLAEDREY